MSVLLIASTGDIHRARDGANFAAIGCLAGAYIDAFGDCGGNKASVGPGVSAAVPGTHFYFSMNGGTIGRCSGNPFTLVAGGPVRSRNYQIRYDPATDRMYVAYAGPNPGEEFRVAWFNFAEAWTTLPATQAIATGSGAIGIIPSGAHAGQLIAGWQNDGRFPGTRNVVQRYDGAAWQDDLFLDTRTNVLQFASWGDSTVLCLDIDAITAASNLSLVQLRAADGTWSDITPVAWNVAGGRMRAVDACQLGDDLIVAFYKYNGTRREIWKRTAAGVWSLVLDMVAEGTPVYPSALTTIDDVAYLAPDDGSFGHYFAAPLGGAWARHVLANGGAEGFTAIVQGREGTISPTEGNCSGEYVDPVVVAGFWDGQAFVAWAVDTVWTQSQGLWTPFTSSYGTQLFMGDGVAFAVGHGNLGSVWTAGQINVVDPFVLIGRPPNGKGFVNVQIDNSLAPGHELLGAANYPLFLPDGYEFVCPSITSVDPASGPLAGGNIVTLHGTNFFGNGINPSLPVNYAKVVNRIWVRNGLGTLASPYKIVEVPYHAIVVVDTETVTFPMPSFPGGTDPDVELLFAPAGLAPFGFGAPVGILPTYRCPLLSAAYSYTGLLDFAVLGSLETLLGLGGTGGDVAGPSSSGGGGGGGGQPRCATDVTPGPCLR